MATVFVLAAINIVSLLYFKRSIAFYKLLGALAVLLFLSVVHYLYTGFAEFTLLSLVGRLVVYLLAADFLVFIYIFYVGGVWALLRDVIYATALNSVFVVAAFSFPAFQGFLRGVMDYGSQLNWIETRHRIFDISLGGGATGSFTFALVYLVGLSVPVIFRPKFYYVLMFLIAIAAGLMGRTGVYLIVLITFLAVLKGVFSFSLRNASVFLCLVGTAFLAVYLYRDIIFDSAFFYWAAEGYAGNNDTANALINMFFLPEHDLLLGDGHFGRVPPNIIYSDVGYVRALHAIGIIGVFLLYGWLLYFVFIVRSSFKGLPFPSVDNLIVLMTFFIFIMNVKEFHIGSRGTSLLYFLVVLTLGGCFISSKPVGITREGQ
ncbi:hypothetical protein C1949_09410 [Halopseudomonas oceani]|uniref:Uncharacterized protein n=2 Tax=Halopseudomonas oceani TaxID=1708783 RepID=A0A2P4EVI2_9GAMM|nr:hypothetical protein C1949_09410 [Halopseudomonas oceani]